MKTLLKSFLFFCFLTVYCSEKLYSQVVYNWSDFVENYFVGDVENPPDEAEMEALYSIHRQRYDINTVTKEQLETLPFLSSTMIEEILAYQYRYGPLKSLDELQLVRTMDFETFQYLSLFLTVTDIRPTHKFPSFNDFLKYGKRSLLLQGEMPLYWKDGYKRHPPDVIEKNPNKEYLGNRFSTSVRFDWSYRDRVSAGFTADQDAGEPLFTFSNKNKGFDYYSYYFLVRDFNRWLKTLVVGQYRLGFGQGLIMNTDFSMGKNILFTSSGVRGNTIKKHSSRSEYNYFRGVAATLRLNERLQATAFYSYVDKDANVDENGLITSWKTDGYHRTPLETTKKQNTVNQTFGGNVDYTYRRFHIGLTGVYNYFNRLFKTYDSGYRKYYPDSFRQWNVSTDYRYVHGRHSIQGEFAYSGEGALAMVNTLNLGLVDNLQAVVLHRFYSYKYNAMYGRSFSENSRVKNESGLFGGIRFIPSYKLNIAAYVDVFYFPWETYRALGGAKGYEFFAQGGYALSEGISFQVRYRFKNKQQNHSVSKDDVPELAFQAKHGLRLQGDAVWRGLLFKTTFNGILVKFADMRSKGFLFSQSVKSPTLWKRLEVQFNGHYFHTDDYATRLSAYESGLLYQFGFSSFYGHGYRLSALLRYAPFPSLRLLAKFGHTRYFDRTFIGSGNEKSDGDRRENISLQIHFNF